MNWLSLILAVLSLVDKFTDWLIERKWIAEGERRQIARAQIESARRSGYAKEIMAAIDVMPEPAVDDELRRLEPGEPSDGDRQLLSDVSKDNKTKG